MQNGRLHSDLKKDGTGTIIYKDGLGEMHDFAFWLGSPEGSRLGMGNWGDPANHYVHEPTDVDGSIILTMAFLTKAQEDVPHVTISAIYTEVDQNGVYQVHFDIEGNQVVKQVGGK